MWDGVGTFSASVVYDIPPSKVTGKGKGRGKGKGKAGRGNDEAGAPAEAG